MNTIYRVTILAWLVGACLTVDAAEPTTANKTRLFIVNDDGEVRLPLDGKDWDRYMGERLRHAVGTQVDSYFLNIGATPGIVHSLQSTMAYWAVGKEAPAVYDEATRRYITEAREAGMEVFASIRMNDTHDAWGGWYGEHLFPQLKKDHPEWLVASKTKRAKHGG